MSRPEWADSPGAGQESVWDYPRPPRVEPCSRRVRVVLGGRTIAETDRAFRVLETSHPPTHYLPRSAFVAGSIGDSPRTSYCEYKGLARYHVLIAGNRMAPDAGWSYASPTPEFSMLRDHVAVYPGRVDACYLDDERVQAQPGDFYGGWITAEIVGPFKGGPGTAGW